MEYYNELKSYQINKHEKKKLYWKWKLIKCQESKAKLIMSFMPMALEIATKFSENIHSIEVNDYLQEGYLIIDMAIDRYDPTRAELSTFIYHMLRWNFKKFTQVTISPVKFSQKAIKILKEHNVSLNPIYWSDIECYYNNNGNCSDTILNEEE